jgi:hypothetical protein
LTGFRIRGLRSGLVVQPVRGAPPALATAAHENEPISLNRHFFFEGKETKKRNKKKKSRDVVFVARAPKMY